MKIKRIKKIHVIQISIFNISLFIMPFLFLLNIEKLSIALVSFFIAMFAIDVFSTLKNMNKNKRNNNYFINDKLYLKETFDLLKLSTLSALAISMITSNFLFSTNMLNWTNSWYTMQSWITWFLLIELIATLVLIATSFSIIRLLMFSLAKNLKKIIIKTFILIKKLILNLLVAIRFLARIFSRFNKQILANLIVKLHIMFSSSTIKYSIINDEQLVIFKKGNFPYAPFY